MEIDPIGIIPDILASAASKLALPLPASTVSGNPHLGEARALAALAYLIDAEVIFEIGTFNGSTAFMLALLPSTRKIFTLDLPPGASTMDPVPPGDELYLAASKPTFPDKIMQLWGDSMTFDFMPYHGLCDLVFVMGSHAKAVMVNDLGTAKKLIRNDGWVVWHAGTPEGLSCAPANVVMSRISDRMVIVQWK